MPIPDARMPCHDGCGAEGGNDVDAIAPRLSFFFAIGYNILVIAAC